MPPHDLAARLAELERARAERERPLLTIVEYDAPLYEIERLRDDVAAQVELYRRTLDDPVGTARALLEE
jgi:hypothetical protein